MPVATLHSIKVFGRTLGLSALALALQGCLMEQAAREGNEGEVVGPSRATAANADGWGTDADSAAEEIASGLAKLDPGARERLKRSLLQVVPEHATLSDRIRVGMSLPDRSRPEVAAEVAWYSEHQGHLDRVTERAALYLPTVLAAIEERGLPTELALLPVIESAYEPLATSPSKAAGLWQIIPATGERFGLAQNAWYDGRRDVTESTRAALDYLEYLHNRFNGDWLHAIAAYNWGEGNVERAIERNRARGKPTDLWSLELRKETRDYVPRLLGMAEVVSSPALYGVTLAPLEDGILLAAVDVGGQISLKTAARLAGLEEKELHRFNPGYRRGTTDPSGRHTLLLPTDKVETFSTRLAELPKDQWVHTRYHEVKSGESLSGIATKYWVSMEQLRAANGLADGELRAGSTLLIPTGAGAVARAPETPEGALARKGAGSKREYAVKSGDNLWTIARTHKVSVQELAAWNGLSPRSALKPGQKLAIWSDSAPDLQVPARKIGYVIQKGDSLLRIAQRFNISVEDLRRWNRDLTDTIHPGRELTVFLGERKS